MNAFERAIARAHQRLRQADRRAQADVLKAYGSVHRRLIATLAALTRRIEQAEAQGMEVRPGWLFAQERYQHLLRDLERGTIDLAGRAVHLTRQGQVAVAALAREDLLQLAAAAAGPAPPVARRQLLDTFARVLTTRCARWSGSPATAPRWAACSGSCPAERQRRLRRPRLRRGDRPAGQVDRPRRPLCERDHVGAGDDDQPHRGDPRHRSTSHDLMRHSPVVVGWTWHAHRDPSTCPVCSAMHGSVHPKTETLRSHPQCRCTMVPRTTSWEQLGFRGIPDRQPSIPAGAGLFARLPAGQQRAILGPTRYRLYRAGALRLEDLVRPTSSPR